MCLSPGQRHDAIRCMEVVPRRKRIYASCGTKVILLDIRQGIAMEKAIETVPDGYNFFICRDMECYL